MALVGRAISVSSGSSVVRFLCVLVRVRGEFFERFHLRLSEVPPAPKFQPRIADWTNRDAPELIDRVSDRVEHVPNLAISPFVDGDLQRGVPLATTRVQTHRGRRHALALDGDAAAEPIEIVRVGNAQHLRFVDTRDAVARMGQTSGEIAVIRQDQ